MSGGEAELLGAVQSADRVYLIGNGGSAAVCSHAMTDLMLKGKPAYVLTDPALMSCMANDFGWDRVYAKPLEKLIDRRDLLIAVSSSGKSPDIVLGAITAKEAGAAVVTLSGFQPSNPLRAIGDHNLWVDSCDYGTVELEHAAILHRMTDRLRA